MLANIIIGVTLVCVLPCKSQNQKFFEVPFDEEVHPTPKLQEPHHFIPVNQFPLQQSFENRNVQTGSRNFFDNRQLQQRVHQQGIRTNLGLTGATNQEQFENFPLNQDFIVEHQPNSFKQPQDNPVNAQHITRNKKNKQRVSGSISAPSDLLQPVNTYVNIEEPTLTLIDQVESKPITTNSFQTRSQFPSTFRHQQQISQRPTLNQFQTISPQFIQPPIATNVPRTSQRGQEFLPVIQQRQTIAQIPQVHRPRIHRPQGEQQPSFFINVPPNQAKLPAHRFVNQRPQQQNNFRTSNVQNTRDREEEIFRQQAENAKYSFSSQIDDNINGNQHEREEVRDGVAVKGRFAYSDGFVRRIVHYEADDKGYRVVKEEEEPLGNGPRFNPKGQANVSSFVAGNALQYSITSDDIQKKDVTPLETRAF